MAGDWIPIDHDFPEKVETLAIHEATGAPIGEIMLRLHRFWCLVDKQTDNGVLAGVGMTTLAAICGGDLSFWEAVRSVGWLDIGEDNSVKMPGFKARLATKGSARQRLKWAQSKRRQRARKREGSPLCPGGQQGGQSGGQGGGQGGGQSPNQNQNQNQNQRSTSKLRFEVIDREEADRQWAAIQQVNPTQKDPNLDAWANTIRLMRERDKRSIEEVRSLFDWAHGHDFWGGVILSPTNLRKHWDKMQAQRATRGARNAKQDRGRYRGGDQPHVESIQV